MKASPFRGGGAFAGLSLSLLILAGAVRAEELAPGGFRVQYDPPRLSVRAREASLAAVLDAIDAKIGFSVARPGLC